MTSFKPEILMVVVVMLSFEEREGYLKKIIIILYRLRDKELTRNTQKDCRAALKAQLISELTDFIAAPVYLDMTFLQQQSVGTAGICMKQLGFFFFSFLQLETFPVQNLICSSLRSVFKRRN